MSSAIFKTALLLLAVVAMTGCANRPEVHSALYTDECELGTMQSDHTAYHALAYYPREHALLAPGMVIGIEKSAEDRVKKPARKIQLKSMADQPNASPDTIGWLDSLLVDNPTSMFISHAVSYGRNSSNKSHGIDEDRTLTHQSIYSLYQKTKLSEEDYVHVEQNDWKDCERNPIRAQSQDENPYVDAMQASRDAVQIVRKNLDTALQNSSDYTHVLVVVMGWNTLQAEAIQNFNSIYLSLKDANDKSIEFRPYIIGVTWPSEWDSGLLPEYLVHAASLFDKADDADEIAAGWLGALIHQAVLSMTTKHKKPVYVIGHSFGARAATHAVCNGSQFAPFSKETREDIDTPSVDWLVSLQGAYSLHRFTHDGAGLNHLSYGTCPSARQLLFTASDNDVVGRWGGYFGIAAAGTAATYESVKANNGTLPPAGPRFKLYQASSEGDVAPVVSASTGSKFHYVNATKLIHYQSYGTGAGAHSDIYRKEMGHMLWQFFNAK